MGAFDDLIPQKGGGGAFADLYQPLPTDGNSFIKNVATGVGSGMVDLGLGVKQRLDDAAAYLENKFGGQRINQALGLKNAADIQKATQARIDEKRQLDAPLMATVGGRVGDFASKAAPAIGAMMLPGGQTFAGSVIANGVLGALEPTATGESAANNALQGAAGAGIGYGAGKLVGMGVGKLAERATARAAASEGANAVAASARDAGYVLPPSSTNPSIMNSTLEGLAGKVSTAQKASIKNQNITNAITAKELGLDPFKPMTKEALDAVRSKAFNEGYMPVRSAGMMQADDAFLSQLDNIVASNAGASRSFPGIAKNEIPDVISTLRQQKFDAGDAIDAIRVLRDSADTAYRQGNGALGSATKQAAKALEDVIERNLSSGGAGAQDALQAYRNARQLIAKTHTVEKALDQSTGNISAKVLKAQLEKGKPLSGGLQTIAETAQAFPKAVEVPKASMLPVSPLDFYASLGLGTTGAAFDKPWLAALPLARVGARSLILSKPYQNSMAVFSPGLLSGLSSETSRALPGLLSRAGSVSGAMLPGLLNFSE